MELLIKGTRVVDWTGEFVGDIYIKDGVICEIGKNIEKNCKVLNGEGYTLLPSFIDMHCHFRDPGLTYKEDLITGSNAAYRGGYTAVNLMANTKPVCSDMAVVNYVLEKAKSNKLVDIHQTVSITRDLEGKDISHLDSIEYPVRFISDDGKEVSNSEVMIKAMVKAKEKGFTVICHAESEELNDISTRLSENVMTWRDIALANFTGCPLHIAHVSTKEAMQYVIAGKKDGQRLTCEVAPHHIALNSSTKYRVNPPLRENEDIEFLIKAMEEGWVDAIATDHAPHSEEDKRNGAPGISGIEVAFATCYTKLVREGHIPLTKLSELMSKRPAELMGLNKGQIKIGFDGDLVLLKLEEFTVDSEKFASKGKNTPINNEKLWGKIMMTIKNGEVMYSAVDNC